MLNRIATFASIGFFSLALAGTSNALGAADTHGDPGVPLERFIEHTNRAVMKYNKIKSSPDDPRVFARSIIKRIEWAKAEAKWIDKRLPQACYADAYRTWRQALAQVERAHVKIGNGLFRDNMSAFEMGLRLNQKAGRTFTTYWDRIYEAQTECGSNTVSGTVVLPEGSTVAGASDWIVEIQDTTLVDAPATVIGADAGVIADEGSTEIPFAAGYDTTSTDEQATYTVNARIDRSKWGLDVRQRLLHSGHHAWRADARHRDQRRRRVARRRER